MATLSRILIVEDEPDIQVIATMVLETVGGFTVHCSSSGKEALAAAPTFAPDLILLDVMMPGLDGPATLHALRALAGFASTPIIFMTAKVQPQEIAYLKSLGALDVISKPFDPMALPSALQYIWEKQHA